MQNLTATCSSCEAGANHRFQWLLSLGLACTQNYDRPCPCGNGWSTRRCSRTSFLHQQRHRPVPQARSSAWMARGHRNSPGGVAAGESSVLSRPWRCEARTYCRVHKAHCWYIVCPFATLASATFAAFPRFRKTHA